MGNACNSKSPQNNKLIINRININMDEIRIHSMTTRNRSYQTRSPPQFKFVLNDEDLQISPKTISINDTPSPSARVTNTLRFDNADETALDIWVQRLRRDTVISSDENTSIDGVSETELIPTIEDDGFYHALQMGNEPVQLEGIQSSENSSSQSTAPDSPSPSLPEPQKLPAKSQSISNL